MRVGPIDVRPDEQKPNAAVKMRIPASFLIGTQSAKQAIPVRVAMVIIMLYRPTLSANKPGTIRPTILFPFS